MRPALIASAVFIVLAVLVFWPGVDLAVAGWFYRPGSGFFLGDQPLLAIPHVIAYAGSRMLALALFLLAVMARAQHRPVAGLNAKAWLFLFLALLLGPALIANVVFKDHWGRARPRDIAEFGGDLKFTPALVPSDQCVRNCSFVNGDGSFGFFLPAFGYVVPKPKSRRVFWAGMGAAAVFGFVRIAVGAHFLSDTLFGAFFMLAAIALLHGAMFGWQETRRYWRNWLFFPEKSIG